MFIRRKKVKNKYSSNYYYYYLVKEIRQVGKLKQVVVEYLGAMRYDKSIINKLLKELEKKYGEDGLVEKFWKVYKKSLKKKKRRRHVRKKKENKG